MTQQHVVMNPWELAMNPPEQTQAYWGQMTVTARLVCLVKGVGKVDYTEGAVMPDGSEPRPVTAVRLNLIPLPEMKLQWGIEREPLAQGWGEWGEITLPSLKECGILELPALNGAWVKAELVPTGQTWTKNGEKKTGTAFRFLRIFANEADCRADYNNRGNDSSAQYTGGNGGNGGNTEQKPEDKERETALKFAKVYVQNACRAASGDLDKARELLAPQLAKQPLISKFYTVDSPEIIEMMLAGAG